LDWKNNLLKMEKRNKDKDKKKRNKQHPFKKGGRQRCMNLKN